MKKTNFLRTLILSVLMSVTAVFTANAEVGDKFKVGDLYYKVINDNSVAVTSQNNSKPYWDKKDRLKGDITIPQTVTNSDDGKNYTVTEIGDNAFSKCYKITSITLPSSVTKIGKQAYRNITKIEHLNIPNTITEIDDEAFIYCSFKSITIPNSVTKMGKGVFESCIYLEAFTWNSTLTEIPEKTFQQCHRIKNLTIPNSVTKIGDSAFEFCAFLTDVTIPNSVTKIGNNVFKKCKELKTINLPNTLTTIGNNAFEQCIKLTAITLPNSLKEIGESAFTQSAVKSIVIPNSVTKMGKQVFFMSGLTSITLSNSMTEIPELAFSFCTHLTSVTIPNSITKIGTGAFSYTNLQSIELPNSVTEIGKEAFAICQSLSNVNIPSSVTKIGESAFKSCLKIETMDIPNSVTEISSSAFNNCKKLQSVQLPNSVTKLGKGVFRQCESLRSIIIPESIQEIDTATFLGCTNLSSVSIPKSVTKIRMTAFGKCASLSAVELPENLTEIGYESFQGCTSLEFMIIPPLVTKIEGGAFQNCSALKKVEIPASVRVIDGGAFRDCNSLKTMVCKISDLENLKIGAFGVFYGVPTSTCWLTVPKGTKSAYQQHTIWKKFKNIKERDFSGYEVGERFKSGILHYEIINPSEYEVAVVLSNYPPPYWVNAQLGDFNIPSIVNYKGKNFAVTKISGGAFWGCSSLTSAVIPNSVTFIEDVAFYQCASLKSVTIPNSVTKIGESVFGECTSLTSIISQIGNVENVDVNDKTFDGVDKEKCTLYVPKGKIEDYKSADYWKDFKQVEEGNFLPPNYQIGDKFKVGNLYYQITNTFYNQVAIVPQNNASPYWDNKPTGNINIPNTVNYKETEFTVVKIDEFAFNNCEAITSVVIPKGVKDISTNAFAGCTSLISIEVDKENPNYSSDNGVLFNKDKTTLSKYPMGKNDKKYLIPNSVTKIESNAFSNCSSLTSIEIPNTIKEIGSASFEGCTSFTSIVIPNNITDIEPETFKNCSSLTFIEIPNSVKKIGSTIFEGCTSLNSIASKIDNVKNVDVDDKAFEGFDKEKCTIYVPAGKVDDYQNAEKWKDFNNIKEADYKVGDKFKAGDLYYKITNTLIREVEVVLPNVAPPYWDNEPTGKVNIPATINYKEIEFSVTKVGKFAFRDCKKITSVVIPKGVLEVKTSAFWNCTSLTSIEVDKENPNYSSDNGVLFNKDKTTLLQYPIGKNDKKYTIPNSVTKIGYGTFSDCSSLISIEIPTTVVTIEKGTFMGCTALTSIVLPNAITDIEPETFRDCTSLTSIEIPNSVKTIYSAVFDGCTSLTSIISKIENVKEVDVSHSAFDDIDKEKCTLYVPKGKKEDYKNADYWKDFKNIKENNTAINYIKLTNPISVVGNNITISEVAGKNVKLYSLSGQVLYNLSSTQETVTLSVKQAGVYVLQVGNATRVIKL